MKKIILVCEGLHNRAGIERMTVDLANLLVDSYNVIIVVINQFLFDECPFQISKKIKVISLNQKFPSIISNSYISLIKELRRIFKTERPNVIITVATPLVRITAPASWGLKIRNIAWEHFNIYAGSKIGTIYKIIAPWLVNRTIALTEADRRAYKKWFAPRVNCIPNFTNIGKNDPSQCKNKVLLAVGRHAPQKGFDMLIKAWSKTNLQDWKLRIVGSGADKENNIQLAKELGIYDRIEFKDAHPDIVKDFQDSSCFVLSSRFEGLVLVLIEAKMMGLPCISFNCPQSPKEIIRDGIDGWLVKNGDIDALAQQITISLNNEKKLKEFGSEARKDAKSRYSPIAIKKNWIQLIENI